MNDIDRCKNMKPRDDNCYQIIDNTTSFDFLIDCEPIKVFYNEATLGDIEKNIPVSLQQYKDLIQINAFHTSVGFQSNTYSFTIDLICKAGMEATLSPIITNNNITWNNKNDLTYNDANSVIYGKNIPYWDHSTYITTITKTNFMDALKDIKNYLLTYPMYALFNVVNSKKIDLLHPELSGITCDSFAYFVLKTLQKYGAAINSMTAPKANIIAYVADSIQLLDFSKDKDKIITFYNTYQQLYSAIITEINSKPDFAELIMYIHTHISQLLNNKIIYYCYDKDDKPNYYELTLNQNQPIIATYTYGLLTKDIQPKSIFGVHGKVRSVCVDDKKAIRNTFIILFIILGVLLLFAFIYYLRK